MFDLWTDVAQLQHYRSPSRYDIPRNEPLKREKYPNRPERTEEALVAALDKKREQERAGRKRCT